MDTNFISSLSNDELNRLSSEITAEITARYDRRKESAWTKAMQALQEYMQEFGGIQILTFNEDFYISDLLTPEIGYIDAH